MRKTSAVRNELTVSVRTEAGRTEVVLSLDGLTAEERAFLFRSVARTHQGGSGDFSLMPREHGDGLTLAVGLIQPRSVAAEVHSAVG